MKPKIVKKFTKRFRRHQFDRKIAVKVGLPTEQRADLQAILHDSEQKLCVQHHTWLEGSGT